MEQYLRLVPPDYAAGVMQDVHWSGGAIGYFPSYALGNMYAAQFYAKAQQKLGNLQEMFEVGEFGHFLGWLRENIHSQGSRHLPRNLVKAVTGEELSAHHLIRLPGTKVWEAVRVVRKGCVGVPKIGPNALVFAGSSINLTPGRQFSILVRRTGMNRTKYFLPFPVAP